MKKQVLILLVCALAIVLWSCSKDQIANVTKGNEGSVNLRFDKSSSPAGISSGVAIMTREGYSTITGQLNIASSTSAELQILNVEQGVWHLKVNAYDNNGIMYSGETDITVAANVTTIADFILITAGQLQFKITWSIPSSINDYLGNPIFGKFNSINSPSLGTASAFVLFEDNKYKMWYANMYTNRKYDVNYAESSDGIAWSVRGNNPVIVPGSGMAWDSYAVYPGAVIKEDQTYKMYYVGVTSMNGDSYVGLATSTDGINWTKNQLPVIMSLYRRMAVNTVLKYNGKYYLYYNYTNISLGNSGIGLATSTDGLNWTTVTDNLIVNDQSWETSGIISPCVRYVGNKFIMVYGTLSNNGFGLATSTDGINWIKSNTNPIFSPQVTLWSSQVRYPYLLKIGEKYRLYYTGYANNLLSIAFAEGDIL